MPGDTLNVVVVGHGLAGRYFHAPLIRRQPRLRLHGLVVRDPDRRALALATWPDARGYADLDAALDDPAVDLVVIATPHDTHAELTCRTLDRGTHCVVDKVMALTTSEADAMIGARDRSGRMLSVFHNRRWDWDFATMRQVLAAGRIGRPLLIESAVCRYSVPRTWRGDLAVAGTILFDWGAHLVDQAFQLGLGPCRRLTAWLLPGPWPGVDAGGHGRILLEFDTTLVQAETSRVCRLDRPRFWVVGSRGGFVKHGLDPQEEALRKGDLALAHEVPDLHATLRAEQPDGSVSETRVAPVRTSWDAYYANIADHLLDAAPLAVTAEDGRLVVLILEAASRSSREHRTIEGPWPGP